MIGPTLFRYFLRRYLGSLVQLVAIAAPLALLADTIEFARRASDWPGYSFLNGVGASLLKLPFLIQEVLPFLGFFAAISALTQLNSRHELVVARAAGLSAWQFLSPLCAASFVVGLAGVLALNPLAAGGLGRLERFESDLRGTAADSVASDHVPWIKQRTNEGLTIIGAKSVSDRGRQLSGAVFLRLNEAGDLTDRYDAASASLEDGEWVLRKVTRTGREGVRQTMETFRIATELRPEYVEQQLSNPDTVSVYELPGRIAAARVLGLQPNAFAMELFGLLRLPFLLVAMTLIAASVSMGFVRSGQLGRAILGGALAAFLLYVSSVLVGAFGKAGLVPPPIAAAIPVAIAFFFGTAYLLHREDG